MMKQVHLLYFSPTHTTKRVLHAIADGVGIRPIEHDMTDLRQLQQSPAPTFTAQDLVVIGVPVYSGRVPGFLADFIQSMRGQNTPCVLVAVYGNRAYEDCLTELYDLVIDHGFVPVGAAAFIGQHSFSTKVAGGRPNPDDLDLAQDFGKQLAQKLQGTPVALAADAVPGNRPYREVSAAANTMFPTVGTALCQGCKACVLACPTHNIVLQGDKAVVCRETCLRCHGCVRACPSGAIAFTAPEFLEMVKNFEAKFAEPDRAPELFL